MTGAWDAGVAVATPSDLGEGPWWDGDRLIWVDITAGRVHAYVPASGAVTTTELGDAVGFVVGRSGGGYLAGTAGGLVALDRDLQPGGSIAAPPDLDQRRRINDGACDPAGRVLFGTVDPSGAETGTLWSFTPDGAFHAVVEGVAMSNGLGFSPDGRELYYVDSLTRRVDRFRYDTVTGTASDRRAFFRVPDSAGLPDGLAVDERGCVWLAIWGAGEVWQITPAGERGGAVRVGVAETTSCAFAGDRLYVTSAPGTLFVAHVGARGAPVWMAATRSGG
jgi:sugar lactone lactonase YvrE